MNLSDFDFFARLSRFQRLYSKGLAHRLSPYDVNPGYLPILAVLWEKDNIIQKELNEKLEVEQATLSNSLKRMERDGLITRTPRQGDRRHHTIVLTERGHAVNKVVTEAVHDILSVVNKGLTINDRRYFNRIMRQMTEQLENDLSDPLFVLLDEITD